MSTQTATEATSRHTASCVRKRKLTDDRRRQNREAQRRYRERRKVVQSPIEHNDNILAGLSEQISCIPSFPDNLFQPIDDSIFTEPLFLSDMLLLNSLPDMSGPVDPLPDEQEHNTPTPPTATTDTLTLLPRPPSIQPAHSSLPSPYKNHLTIRKLSFYAARIQNALYLGLPTFLAQKENDVSPWYWHTQFALLVASTSTSTSTSTFTSTSPSPSTLTPTPSSHYEFAPNRPVRHKPCFTMSSCLISDLAPTPLQRTHAHGMYLDVVPFPIFRDRAITLLAMDPPAFDEVELKRDMEEGGLVVWGVGHGKAGSGALVRDRRNWECAGWFWRKWRLLVEGSGLEEQSRWWRMMRGEEGDEDADPDGDGEGEELRGL